MKKPNLKMLKPTKAVTVWIFAALAVLALILRVPIVLNVHMRLLNSNLFSNLITILAESVFAIERYQVYQFAVMGVNVFGGLLFSAFIAFGAISLYATFKKVRENKRGFGTVLFVLQVIAYVNLILTESFLQFNVQILTMFNLATWLLDMICILPGVLAFLFYVILTIVVGIIASVPKKEKKMVTENESVPAQDTAE